MEKRIFDEDAVCFTFEAVLEEGIQVMGGYSTFDRVVLQEVFSQGDSDVNLVWILEGG